jgi:hypothetical protein
MAEEQQKRPVITRDNIKPLEDDYRGIKYSVTIEQDKVAGVQGIYRIYINSTWCYNIRRLESGRWLTPGKVIIEGDKLTAMQHSSLTFLGIPWVPTPTHIMWSL